VGAGTELKAINTLLKRQSDIVGATVTHRSLADVKAAMLSIIQSQLDWQRSLDDMFEVCGVDTRMTVRGKCLMPRSHSAQPDASISLHGWGDT